MLCVSLATLPRAAKLMGEVLLDKVGREMVPQSFLAVLVEEIEPFSVRPGLRSIDLLREALPSAKVAGGCFCGIVGVGGVPLLERRLERKPRLVRGRAGLALRVDVGRGLPFT